MFHAVLSLSLGSRILPIPRITMRPSMQKTDCEGSTASSLVPTDTNRLHRSRMTGPAIETSRILLVAAIASLALPGCLTTGGRQPQPVDPGFIRLEGKSDGGWPSEWVEIAATDRIALRSRWKDEYGLAYQLDIELTPESWATLCSTLGEIDALAHYDSQASHGVYWSFRMSTTQYSGGFTAWCPIDGDPRADPYLRTIDAIVSTRDAALAYARRGSADVPWATPTHPVVSQDEEQGIVRGLQQEGVRSPEIFAAARYRNRGIVDAVVALLDIPGPQAAACAALSWISGRPPSANAQLWKEWWTAHRQAWEP